MGFSVGKITFASGTTVGVDSCVVLKPLNVTVTQHYEALGVS